MCGDVTGGRGRLPRQSDATSNYLESMLNELLKQGKVNYNVAALVDRLPVSKVPMQTFTTVEVEKLLDTFAEDRLGHVWHLALVGLRRGELCGLRWTDIDFEAQTISIEITRVVVDGEVVEGDTKSETSTRVLPLTLELLAALRAASAHAGRGAARRRAPTGRRSGYVVVDRLGRRYHPDTVSDYWAAACAKAGVKRIRLRDARHTCGTLMHLEHNVPVAIISAWLGHADTAFTMRTYVHNQPDKLALAAESISLWTRRRSPHSRESDLRFRSSCGPKIESGSRTGFLCPTWAEVPFPPPGVTGRNRVDGK